MGEKKNKMIVEEKDELNLKRKVEVSDHEVKKKKKKDKHLSDAENTLPKAENENADSSIVKKS